MVQIVEHGILGIGEGQFATQVPLGVGLEAVYESEPVIVEFVEFYVGSDTLFEVKVDHGAGLVAGGCKQQCQQGDQEFLHRC